MTDFVTRRKNVNRTLFLMKKNAEHRMLHLDRRPFILVERTIWCTDQVFLTLWQARQLFEKHCQQSKGRPSFRLMKKKGKILCVPSSVGFFLGNKPCDFYYRYPTRRSVPVPMSGFSDDVPF